MKYANMLYMLETVLLKKYVKLTCNMTISIKKTYASWHDLWDVLT